MTTKVGQTYLKLFHGRKNPKEEMDDWGTSGPIFGPVMYVHSTYGSCVKIGFVENQGLELEETMMQLVGDMLYYDGVYYGDWSTFACTAEMDEEEVTLFYEASSIAPANVKPLRPKTFKDGDNTLMCYAAGGKLTFTWTMKAGRLPQQDAPIKRTVLASEAMHLLPVGWRLVLKPGTQEVQHAIEAEMPELEIAHRVWDTLHPDRQPWIMLRSDVQQDWRNVVNTVLEISSAMVKEDHAVEIACLKP